MFFDQLSKEKNTNARTQPGPARLKINDSDCIVTSKGNKSIQFSYVVNGNEKFIIKYDNCVVIMKDGSDCSFGQYKLRKIMEATNTIPKGEFTFKTLPPLLKGKEFMADLVWDKDQKYLVLGDPDTFKPVPEAEKHDVKELAENPADQNKETEAENYFNATEEDW